MKKLILFVSLLFSSLLFSQNDIGIIRQYNTGKAISACSMHNGYLFVPLGADHGGGKGVGAFAFYDITDPANLVSVFDSRNFASTYQNSSNVNYVGNWAEIHSMPVIDDGNVFVMSERRNGSAGFSLFDVTGFPNTQPKIISRYSYPGVTNPSNYDGYSFSLASKGSNFVIAPTGANGLYIVDITDKNNPVLAKRIPRSDLGNLTLRSAIVVGDLLILTSGAVNTNSPIAFLDITDPYNPSIIDFSQSIRVGYQPFVFGSEIFAGADGNIVGYDFTDPSNLVATTYNRVAGNTLFNPEYGFGQDNEVFIGHYPGLTKWSLSGSTSAGPMAVAEPTNPYADDYAFITPIGNLAVVASDHNHTNKLNIARHELGNDVTPPSPKYARPNDQSTNLSINSSIGVAFSDFIDPLTMNTQNFQLVDLSNNSVIPGTFNQMFGVVNFVPTSPLKINTTYRVILKAGGIKDWRGNAIPSDTTVTTFSTGSSINDNIPFTINATTPSTTNQNIAMSIDHSINVQYTWDFGDGTPIVTTNNLSVSHQYTQAANYNVIVTANYPNGKKLTLSTVQVIHNPILVNVPVYSSSILFDDTTNTVWNVNPDNNTVTAINGSNNTLKYKITVGNSPQTLTLVGNQIWVANKNDASITIINSNTGTVVQTINLPKARAPFGIVYNTNLNQVYVSYEATGEVAAIDVTSKQVINTLRVSDNIRSLGFVPDSNRLYVAKFISDNDMGKLHVINTTNFSLLNAVDIAIDNSPDSQFSGGGLPNYLGAFSISPDGTQLYIPSKKDNIKKGLFNNGEPLNFEHTVRSMGMSIDLNTNQETLSKRVDFDNSDFANSATFNKYGNKILVTTSGSSSIFILDAYTGAIEGSFESGGIAPRGIVFNEASSKLFIHNFMDRNITVFDTGSCALDCGNVSLSATVKTVAQEETLSAEVLKGKQLFYNSLDSRLSQDAYMSCASCHIDGSSDGRIWDITNLGEGLRNTIDLRGKGKGTHGRLHWSGNFDEVHDFENQIRNLNNGQGLLTDAQFSQTSNTLGTPKAGLSTDLDALAAYVNSLDIFPESPYKDANGDLTPEATSGKQVFTTLKCYECHSGASFTNSAENYLYDVGTINSGTGKRLDKKLLGLDVPTLKGLWATAPYLHDGSASSLEDVLTTKNPNGKHADLSGISQTQINNLVAYLKQIDDDAVATAPSTLELSLAAPFEGDTFGEGSNITLEISSNLPNIQSVDYYINDQLIETVTQAPFSYVLQNASIGVKDVVVKAYYGPNTTGIVSECVQFEVIEFCSGVSINSYPYTENLNAGIGAWTQATGDNGNWTLDASGTPSTGTGPADDFNGGGNYIYTESSTSGLGFNATVNLVSPCIDLTKHKDASFSFYYHMFGPSMGNLSIDVSINNEASWSTLNTINGQQQASDDAAWKQQIIDLKAYDGKIIKLRFSGTTGTSWQSDIAIDEINITAAFAPTDPIAACKAIDVALDANGNATITAADINDGTSFGTLSTDITTFNCTNIGTPVIVTLTATFNSKTETCTATVTVIDTLKPILDVPVLNDVTSSTPVSTLPVPTATDNCDGVISGTTTTVFPITNAGTTTVVWNYTDTSNNVITQNQEVIILDTTNPVAPTNLTNANTTQTTTDLSWNAATDDVGIVAYDVIQDGIVIATITTLNYQVTGLTTNTTYTFEIVARDAAGNVSTTSNPISVTTTDAPPGCADGITTFPYTESFENTLGAWSQATNDDIDWTIDSAGTPSNNTGPTAASNGSYYMYVEASGNDAGFPNKRAILNSPCFDLTNANNATFEFKYHMFGAVDFGTIDLEISDDNGITWISIWNASGNKGNTWLTANVDLAAYQNKSLQLRFNRVTGATWQADFAFDAVNLSATILPSGPIADCKAIDVTLDDNGNATITAADLDNGTSFGTLSIDITTFDCSNIGTPVTVTLTATFDSKTETCTTNVTVIDTTKPVVDVTSLNDVNSTTPVTSLPAPTATDNCDGSVNGTTTAVFPIDNPGTTTVVWTYTDASNNVTTQNQNVNIPDTTSPNIPTNLVAANTTQTTTNLSWTVATDDVGVVSYDVIQDGTVITSVATPNYQVTGLTANTTYTFSIVAKDAAGNVSTNSNSISVITLDVASGCAGGITAFPYTESFENTLGAWTQDTNDDINWTVDSAGTPSSNTGPTTASSGSYYMYVEASGDGTGFPNKQAILNSPCYDLSSLSNAAFEFKYHMFGAADFGTINLEISDDDGTSWSSIWNASGNKGNAWLTTSVDLTPYVGGNIQLRFNRVTGSTWQADFALDTINLSDGTITPPTGCAVGITAFPYNESFENTLGAWSQDSNDDLNWTVDSAGTPSTNTGPTTASNGNYYMFVEASGDGTGFPNKQAILNSPCIDLTNESSATFNFNYHMYGATDFGTINLEVSNDNSATWSSIWSLTGNQGNNWLTQSVNLSAYLGQSIQLRFNRVTGATWQADFALDAVSLTTGTLIRTFAKTKEEPKTSISLRLFPNPVTNGTLNVATLTKDLDYKIYNMVGQLVAKGLLGTKTINVANLEAAVYIIEFSNENETITKRFIKK